MRKVPRAVAWRHTMDNTEGIKSNRPWAVLSDRKANPFGVPGEDYSESYPVTSEPLYTAAQLKAAYAAGLERAAEICDMHWATQDNAIACAAAIRADKGAE